MSSSLVRRLAAGAVLAGLLLAFPAAAAATITGGCTGTGTATSGGVDLTSATEWHVLSTDVGGGTGNSPTKVKAASVAAHALGISIPIASAVDEGEGKTEGSVSGVSVSLFAALGKRFVVSGSADNGCAGQIEIIIDDVNPLLTAFGGGGLLLAIVGLLVVLASMRGGSGLFKRIVDAIFGGLGGLGAALALEQFGVLEPTEPIGLILVIIAAVAAFLTTGLLGGGKAPATTPGPPDSGRDSSGSRWGDYSGIGAGVGGGASLGHEAWAPGSSGAPVPESAPDPGRPEAGSDTERYPGGAVGGGGPA